MGMHSLLCTAQWLAWHSSEQYHALHTEHLRQPTPPQKLQGSVVTRGGTAPLEVDIVIMEASLRILIFSLVEVNS